MTDQTQPDELLISGRRVDIDMLEKRALKRCDLAECQAMCCNGGVYISVVQAEDILANKDLIIPLLPAERQDTALWFDDQVEPDDDHPDGGDMTGTNIVKDPTHPAGQTCIFLLPGSRHCALQKAGVESGQNAWRFKPFYCALHPLCYDKGVLSFGESGEVFQEGGSCCRASDVEIPVFELFDVETMLALGEDGYKTLGQMKK